MKPASPLISEDHTTALPETNLSMSPWELLVLSLTLGQRVDTQQSGSLATTSRLSGSSPLDTPGHKASALSTLSKVQFLQEKNTTSLSGKCICSSWIDYLWKIQVTSRQRCWMAGHMERGDFTRQPCRALESVKCYFNLYWEKTIFLLSLLLITKEIKRHFSLIF